MPKDRAPLSVEGMRQDYFDALFAPLSEHPDQATLETALANLHLWHDALCEPEAPDKHILRSAVADRINLLEGRVTTLYPESDWADARRSIDASIHERQPIDWQPERIEDVPLPGRDGPDFG